ncbi:MAG: universal stress protein, partial [Gemmatimonadetes bacterium]|nr:universal stress protein [Gemmatimonadota bacterium]
MIQRILIPLDGSAWAECALPYARLLQRAFGSKIALLRVLEPDSSGDEPPDSVDWRLLRVEAESYLQMVADRLARQGGEVETFVTVGRASESILETARDWGADLMALSSHGRSGPSRFGLSGTAHKVLSAGETSILLVRVPCAAPGPSEPELKRILVPVDGSARSEWALCLATALARSAGSEIVMIWVIPRPEGVGHVLDEALGTRVVEESRQRADDQLRKLSGEHGAADIAMRCQCVVAGSVARAIDETALREGASLV